MANKAAVPPHSRIPKPAHPTRRQEPLPWQCPKAVEEEPDVERRIAAIQNSPSYRLGERDPDFLGRDDTRGVRLQIDYLKPELLLEQHDIEHTIVVFGSTRIQEPGAAARNVERLRAACRAHPDDTAAQRRLAVAERIRAKAGYYAVAREFGQLVGRASNDHARIAVMTGGGPGIMEAANRGAWDVCAKSVGLNITLPHEQYPNPYLTPDLCFSFHYFALRKLHFLLRAKALVVFPGGYGTFDELFETLTLVQTRKIAPLPVVLVGEHYWRQAFNIDFLIDEGVIDAEDRDLFWYAETAQQIWDDILLWHRLNETPLLPETGIAGNNNQGD